MESIAYAMGRAMAERSLTPLSDWLYACVLLFAALASSWRAPQAGRASGC
jgi:hypothetical protein